MVCKGFTSDQIQHGNFVLLAYPSRPPNKLAGLYRGPMIITSINRPDIIQVRHLISNKLSMVHTSRLRVSSTPRKWRRRKLQLWQIDSFHVKSIMDNEGEGKDGKKWKFRVRWLRYEPEDDTWLKWSAVKYWILIANPPLNLGLMKWISVGMRFQDWWESRYHNYSVYPRQVLVTI